MSNKSFKYKFSVIMPIYNTEPYIAEAVDSILAQTIGFEDSCEIIFINDGSTDGSEEVCFGYKNRYPNNVTYIKQENKGVSAARNAGLEAISGKYISFVDSDDKISKNTLLEVYNFFEKKYDEIDICAVKMDFFGAREGDHHLNDKFSSNRVVDIEKDYQYVLSAIGSCFIKSESLNGNYKFDTMLEIGEDGKFLTELVLNKMSYGIVYAPTYYYRKRVGETSAVSGRWKKRSWYKETPERYFKYLFEYSEKKLGYIPKYVQFLVMYHIKWAIKKKEISFLNPNELTEYKQKIKKLLKSIDKEIIIKQKDFSVDYKVYAISEKLNRSADEIVEYKNGFLCVDSNIVQNVKNLYVGIDFINIKNNQIEIEGTAHGYNVSGFKFGFSFGGKFYEGEIAERSYTERYSLGEVSYKKIPFIVKIPMKKSVCKLTPVVKQGGQLYHIKALRFKQFAKLTEDLDFSYSIVKDRIIRYKKGKLTVQKYSKYSHIKKELKYLQQLIQMSRYDAVWTRLTVVINKMFNKSPIWIISDRLVSAGDNGEALFRYIAKQKINEKVYFAINKDSPDFNRIKKYGNVVNRKSRKYKRLFLMADKIISSHFDKFVFDAFGDSDKTQRNLYNFEYVFLRHGVSKDDMSKQINRYKINASLIVSSSRLEYNDIVRNQDRYGYSKDTVKLTGLPRYDYLDSKPKNKLVLAPTWRKTLAIKPDEGSDKRVYDKDFKKTDYFQFYNSLISDKRIIDALKRHDMKCDFYLHPALVEQAIDFQSNDEVNLKSAPYDYRKAFSEGNVLVTDYSSVAFDFAYLKKPVIYTQFDKETFFKYQYQPGYFSYEDDGFGEVVYDYESAVRSIIKLIGNNTMLDIYKNRVEKFFLYNDKNNSKRVYESIQKV